MKEKELESYNDFKQRAYLESRVTDILNYNVNNDSILLALRVTENDMCKQLTSTLSKEQLQKFYWYIDVALQRNSRELMLVIEQILKDINL